MAPIEKRAPPTTETAVGALSANLAGAWLDVSDARFSRTRGVQRCDGKLLGERVWGELALDTNNTSARLDISVERELQVQGEHALGEHGLFAASKPPP